MSILNNQTDKDLEKQNKEQLPAEGHYYECFHGIKPIRDTDECRECPFNTKCSWFSELEGRKQI